jgi:hypothetical protein
LPKPDAAMLQIAEKIVEQQSGDFDPSEFRDRYEDALRALIEDKRKGKPVRPSKPANDDTKVVDLMAALKQSLESGGGSGQRAESFTAAKTSLGTARRPADAGGWLDMGTQLYLPAGWARRLESRLDPVERLAEPEKDRTRAKGDIREILDRLAEKHGATVRDVTTRRQTVEQPFGTIKSWMGSTHFQMKRLKNVSTEMALHVLAYNMKRVMRILGVGGLMEAIRA